MLLDLNLLVVLFYLVFVIVRGEEERLSVVHQGWEAEGGSDGAVRRKKRVSERRGAREGEELTQRGRDLLRLPSQREGREEEKGGGLR